MLFIGISCVLNDGVGVGIDGCVGMLDGFVVIFYF